MILQEWIVVLVVLLCVAEIIRRFLRFFRSAKENDNPCSNCAGGCDLKRSLDEKRRGCKEIEKKADKKCCG